MRVRTLTVRVVGDIKSFQSSVGQISKETGGFNKLAAAGNAMFKGLALGGAATAVGVGFTVKAFADFDAALNESLAIMKDVTDVQRNDMTQAARAVALETTFSAEQAASAFYFLASSGMDAAQSIEALPLVAKFAQAGMFDLEQATDLLVNSQIALGLQSADAQTNLENLTRVADVLTEANNIATGSVQEFAEALTNKAATAMATMGIEVEEGVAVLAAFAQRGVKGQVAGEKLAIFLRDTARAATRNKDEFAKLGIEIFDTEGNMKNLADVVAEFETALGGMSDAEKAAALESSGMTRSVGDIIRTLMGSSEEIRLYEDALRQAGGTTEEVADKQLQTFNAQMTLLKNQLMDFAIDIGEELVPRLMPLIAWLREQLPVAFAKAKEEFQKFKPFLDDLADWFKEDFAPAAADLALAVADMALKLEPIVKFLRDHPNATKMIAALTALAVSMALIAAVLQKFAFLLPVLKVVGAVLGFIATIAAIIGGGSVAAGIAIVVVVVGALVVAFLLLKDHLGDIWGALMRFEENFKTKYHEFMEWIKTKFSEFKEWLGEKWGDLWQALEDHTMNFVDGVKEKFGAMIEWFKGVPGAIAGAVGDMFGAIPDAFRSAINRIIRWWNNLEFPSFDIPSMDPLGRFGPSIGGGSFGGWDLPDMNPIGLAKGGIVRATPGGILARIGEGRHDEAVMPLDGRGMGNPTYVFNFDGAVISGSMQFKQLVVEAIRSAGAQGNPVTMRGRQI